MITKIINKIKSIFTPSRVKCDHSNGVSKKVKYCGDCKIVLDES